MKYNFISGIDDKKNLLIIMLIFSIAMIYMEHNFDYNSFIYIYILGYIYIYVFIIVLE